MLQNCIENIRNVLNIGNFRNIQNFHQNIKHVILDIINVATTRLKSTIFFQNLKFILSMYNSAQSKLQYVFASHPALPLSNPFFSERLDVHRRYKGNAHRLATCRCRRCCCSRECGSCTGGNSGGEIIDDEDVDEVWERVVGACCGRGDAGSYSTIAETAAVRQM